MRVVCGILAESCVSQVAASDPEAVKQATQTLLKDLDCGHIDVLLLSAAGSASLPSVWPAAEALVATGEVKQLGVAEGSLEAVEGLLEGTKVKPVCNLVELHPMHSQRRLVGTLMRKVCNVQTFIRCSCLCLCSCVYPLVSWTAGLHLCTEADTSADASARHTAERVKHLDSTR